MELDLGSARVQDSRLLRACMGLPVDATPIWLMRQAGQYMPEYREIRAKYNILEVIRTPELACEVTMQPIDAFDLDAAIIFADILPPLMGMGLDLEFIEGKGPVIYNPVRSAADVAQLRVLPPEATLPFTLEAIRLVRPELDSRGIPLIGFSGAPFTLASYAVEGSKSKDRLHVKGLMMEQPDVWHELMSKFSEVAGHYLLAQAQAGTQVLQMFDSWVGEISPDDYEQYVLPYSQRAIAIAKQAGVPVIHFSTGTSGMLDLIQAAGGDVISVDWRTKLSKVRHCLGADTIVQGNLDPAALTMSWEALQPRAQRVLDQMNGQPGHIFNLGHGVLPCVPVENVKRLADFVHEYTLTH
ncbi:MAG: uroporphyrinogen decarboxylase [Chloroflexi bacterium]|nr:uroporphyrinogen decarboxylase [Chloroflexota bacterium]